MPKKLTIEEAHQIAVERGGKCLSEVYINCKCKLKWQCTDGHTWKASLHSIKYQKSWCPYCTKWNNEEICRFVFESIFNYPFPKNHNVLGHNLQLDGYCKEMNIAFEYNGEQHYNKSAFFKNMPLERRQQLDKLKENICLKKGIQLIVVPYYEAKTHQSLIKYISSKLDVDVYIDISQFHKNYSQLQQLRKIANKNGGKLLSTVYGGSKYLLTFSCHKQHLWESTPTNIKSGKWCPFCYGRNKTIDDMHQLAHEHQGKCLSSKYLGASSKLKWKCRCGYTWKASPSVVQKGHWCPRCAGNAKLSLSDINYQTLPHEMQCISEEYINNKETLQWHCHKDDCTFKLNFDNMQKRLKRGYACLLCKK